MRYASARDGAFTDTPIYDHVAWLQEQQYLWEPAGTTVLDEPSRDADWFSYDSSPGYDARASLDSYASYDGYRNYDATASTYYSPAEDYSAGRHGHASGRHRSYAA